MLESTHLARVSSEMYDARFERYRVRRAARIISVNPSLCGVNVRRCEIMDISTGGGILEVSTTIGLRSHYYLEIVGVARRIGCAEVFRRGNRLEVKFIMPLTRPVLQKLVRADFLNGFEIEKVEKARLTR